MPRAASGGREAQLRREHLPPMVLPQHGLTRYLRVRLEVADGVLSWERPRTMLGVVPLGISRLGIPLAHVRGLRLRQRAMRPFRLIPGLLLIGLPLFVLPWWAAVPLIVIGVWVTLVSLGPRLEIDTDAGKHHRTGVCFGHQFDADLFIEAVNGMVDPRIARDGATT